jgi:hypothetical protein
MFTTGHTILNSLVAVSIIRVVTFAAIVEVARRDTSGTVKAYEIIIAANFYLILAQNPGVACGALTVHAANAILQLELELVS